MSTDLKLQAKPCDSRQPLKLLIVEDNPGDADLILEMLPPGADSAFLVETATRLSEALERLRRSAFDLVILDLALPDSDGLETLHAVTTAQVDLPIVVLTGRDDEEIARIAMRKGAQDFMVKGKVTPDLFGRILRHAVERNQNRLALRASEQFLRSTLDALSAHIAIIDADGRILSVNSAWRKFAQGNGCAPEMVSDGANYLDVCDAVLGEDAAIAREFAAGIRSVIAGERTRFELEYPCHGPGAQRWFIGRVTVFAGASPRYAVIAHENITERKASEIEISAGAERLRRVIDASLNCVAVKDAEGRYIVANDAMAELYGTTKEEMIGQTDLHFASRGRLKQTEALKFLDDDRLVSVSGRRRIIETECVTLPDGRQRWFKTIKAPISLPDNPQCVLLIATDISDLRDANLALRNSELRLRTMIDAQPNIVILMDTDLRIIWPNQAACRAARLTREEMIGRYCYEMLRQSKTLCPDCPVWASILQGTVFTDARASVQGRTWRVTGCPVKDENGEITQVVEVAEDITDRVALETQLIWAQRMEAIGTLAAGIAHDFNNILSAIVGYTDLAMDKSRFYSDIYENLEEVAKAGRRAKSLVAQILAFSRQSDSEMGPIQLHLMVKEALKLLRPSLPATIEIQSEIRTFGAIMADPNQIHQVIMNLCTNAYHAMLENGGTLTIRLNEKKRSDIEMGEMIGLPPGDYLNLIVHDTGIGMDKATLDRIFEPYFTTKEKGRGTGLGLSVTYGIVKAHGGGIVVDSEPGKGSTFSIFLPKLDQADIAPATEILDKRIPTGSERVLFVDDEPTLTALADQILTRLGYRVTISNDGREALTLFEREPDRFDIVITDLTMPRLTGDVLTAKILEIRPDMPIIVCTGFSERIDEPMIKALGGRALLMKPLLVRTFAETIRAVLDGESA